jgi:dUTP pyrophosphatase
MAEATSSFHHSRGPGSTDHSGHTWDDGIAPQQVSPHHRGMTVSIRVRRLAHGEDLPLPSYATAGAAGMDLLAAVPAPVTLAPSERRLIPTGLAVALPAGYELQIRPRSGLALRHGIVLPNSPGTIDEDYRGEVQVILLNAGNEAFEIVRGMRIAQAVLSPVVRAGWHVVDRLDATSREGGGFGSTGVDTTGVNAAITNG